MLPGNASDSVLRSLARPGKGECFAVDLGWISTGASASSVPRLCPAYRDDASRSRSRLCELRMTESMIVEEAGECNDQPSATDARVPK